MTCGSQGCGKVFSQRHSSVRTRKLTDDFMIVTIRGRARRTVRVQEDVLTRIGVAESYDRRRDRSPTREMDAETDPSRAGRVRAERALERADHLIDGPGRRLREQTLDELHLRIGRDVASLVREDIESLMAAVHGELSVVAKEPEVLPGGREQVPVVVLVFTDLALEEHVHAGDARLPQRFEDELSSRPRARGGPTTAVRERDDQSGAARSEPRSARLSIARRDDDRRAVEDGGRIRGPHRGLVPVHPEDDVMPGNGS